MDLLNIGILAVSLAVLVAAGFRVADSKRTRETPIVVLVKRRRELATELHRLVGDQTVASRLIQAEALRLNVRISSLEVLEAAIARATKERA